jgi:hypothetical protein
MVRRVRPLALDEGRESPVFCSNRHGHPLLARVMSRYVRYSSFSRSVGTPMSALIISTLRDKRLEVVDDLARQMAKAQLDKNAARMAARRARELGEMTAKGA